MDFLRFHDAFLYIICIYFRFHAIYWPALLMAADLPLPRKGIICHSHWLSGKKKMSKSVGNVVDPMKLKDNIGSDGMRYFLLRTGVLSHDCSKFFSL